MDCKVCKVCGLPKPLSEYYAWGKDPAKQKPRPRCKQCLLEEHHQRKPLSPETVLRRTDPQAAMLQRFWRQVEKTETCWLWTGSGGQYGAFFLSHKDCIHPQRFSYQLHYGPIPDGLWVLHRCDVPRCVNPDHLWLGTQDDNTRDMVEKGRAAKGERNGHARLSDEDVRAIRALRSAGVKQIVLAKRYGVHRDTIRRIASGRLRSHIT